jgi:hypothetical protein
MGRRRGRKATREEKGQQERRDLEGDSCERGKFSMRKANFSIRQG